MDHLSQPVAALQQPPSDCKVPKFHRMNPAPHRQRLTRADHYAPLTTGICIVRDGALDTVVPYTAAQFGRAVHHAQSQAADNNGSVGAGLCASHPGGLARGSPLPCAPMTLSLPGSLDPAEIRKRISCADGQVAAVVVSGRATHQQRRRG
jgi:hypothetical protein